MISPKQNDRCSPTQTSQHYNFDQTVGFYWSYTLLLEPPILMRSWLQRIQHLIKLDSWGLRSCSRGWSALVGWSYWNWLLVLTTTPNWLLTPISFKPNHPCYKPKLQKWTENIACEPDLPDLSYLGGFLSKALFWNQSTPFHVSAWIAYQ